MTSLRRSFEGEKFIPKESKSERNVKFIDEEDKQESPTTQPLWISREFSIYYSIIAFALLKAIHVAWSFSSGRD